MAEPIRPAARKTYGRKNWIFVPTLADQEAPLVTEVTAASALDITRIVFASTGRPAQSTNRATSERRLGDTEQYEAIGTTTYTGGDMTYAFDAQGAALSDGKKLWEKIPAGTTGYLVERMGIARATAPTTGQFVNVFPVEFGPSMPTEAGDGESAESAASCSFAITGPPSFDVTLA